MVEKHETWMRQFYNNKFKPEGGAEKYLSSDFAFRHDKNIPQQRGLFHITRIVVAHVQYIDDYRRWLMRRSAQTEVASRQAVVNRIFKIIRLYLALLSRWEHKDAEMNCFLRTVTSNMRLVEENPNNFSLGIVSTAPDNP